VLDGFGTPGDLGPGFVDNVLHSVSSVQNLSSLLILIDEDGNLIYKLLVDLLVLCD
jgi:hypothetical protein